MSKQSETKNVGGFTLLGLLGISFVILKLCGVIDWSWWLVTLPFWIRLAVLLVIYFICQLGIETIESYERSVAKRKERVKDETIR